MKIKNILHRRKVVTAINVFDRKNGVLTSQKAKYEKPLWFYLAAVMPTMEKAKDYCTIRDLAALLRSRGLEFPEISIRVAINTMLNLDKSIHPHRRNCGVGCYEIVKQLGKVRVEQVYALVGRPSYVYYLGASKPEATRIRRAYNVTTKP